MTNLSSLKNEIKNELFRFISVSVVILLFGWGMVSIATDDISSATTNFSVLGIVSEISTSDMKISDDKGFSHNLNIDHLKNIQTSTYKALSLIDIKVGDRVVVQGLTNNSTFFVKRIILFTSIPTVIDEVATSTIATSTDTVSTDISSSTTEITVIVASSSESAPASNTETSNNTIASTSSDEVLATTTSTTTTDTVSTSTSSSTTDTASSTTPIDTVVSIIQDVAETVTEAVQTAVDTIVDEINTEIAPINPSISEQSIVESSIPLE